MFATKYRRKIFNDGIFAYMQERLKQIKDHYPELDIIKINHDADHIHILAVIPPRMSVSEVVRIIKSNTSKDIKKKFGEPKEKQNDEWGALVAYDNFSIVLTEYLPALTDSSQVFEIRIFIGNHNIKYKDIIKALGKPNL